MSDAETFADFIRRIRAGDDQDRPVSGCDCSLLLRVEFVEKIHERK